MQTLKLLWLLHHDTTLYRAVGAAAGPIFGQTNPRKNAVRASAGCSIVTTLAGIHKLSVGAGGKHALKLEESLCQGVSFGKLRSQ